MAEDRNKRLQAYLLEKSAELSREIETAENGEADDERFKQELARLERVERLLKIHQAAAPKEPRKRWPIVAVFGFTLVVISILLFGRVSRTEIELDAALSNVGFRLSEERALFDDATTLSELIVTGIREARLPPTREGGVQVFPVPSVKMNADSGVITLELLLPEQTVVELGKTNGDRQYRLSLRGTDSELEASLVDRVEVTPHRHAPRQFRLAAPGVLSATPERDEVHLDLTYAKATTAAVAPQLGIDSLSLTRVVRAYDPTLPATRLVSNVLEGTLYLQALNGKPYSLRSGEQLQIRDLRGVIRSLDLTDDHIALQLHGTAAGLSSGIGENRRNLMPTYLEWLTTHEGLLLLWGAVLYVFGIIAGLLRWWGISL